MATFQAPGVYKEEVFRQPAAALRTGVPAFLGYTATAPGDAQPPYELTLWSQFEPNFGPPLPTGYLAYAVRGFFENGGRECYVMPLNAPDTTSPVAL